MTEPNKLSIRPIEAKDREWVRNYLTQEWGSNTIISRGKSYQANQFPGFIAWEETAAQKKPVGLVTFWVKDEECEITSLNSDAPGQGVGTQLLAEVEAAARNAGCKRLWLITTNDNTPALRFYQKRGFHLVALHRDAILVSRQMKPSIPMIGIDGIPIRDEIELEIPLR